MSPYDSRCTSMLPKITFSERCIGPPLPPSTEYLQRLLCWTSIRVEDTDVSTKQLPEHVKVPCRGKLLQYTNARIRIVRTAVPHRRCLWVAAFNVPRCCGTYVLYHSRATARSPLNSLHQPSPPSIPPLYPDRCLNTSLMNVENYWRSIVIVTSLDHYTCVVSRCVRYCSRRCKQTQPVYDSLFWGAVARSDLSTYSGKREASSHSPRHTTGCGQVCLNRKHTTRGQSLIW